MAPVVAILCYVAKLKKTMRDAYCISGDSVFLYGEGVPGELSDLVNPVLSWVTSPTVFTYNPPLYNIPLEKTMSPSKAMGWLLKLVLRT